MPTTKLPVASFHASLVYCVHSFRPISHRNSSFFSPRYAENVPLRRVNAPAAPVVIMLAHHARQMVRSPDFLGRHGALRTRLERLNHGLSRRIIMLGHLSSCSSPRSTKAVTPCSQSNRRCSVDTHRESMAEAALDARPSQVRSASRIHAEHRVPRYVAV